MTLIDNSFPRSFLHITYGASHHYFCTVAKWAAERNLNPNPNLLPIWLEQPNIDMPWFSKCEEAVGHMCLWRQSSWFANHISQLLCNGLWTILVILTLRMSAHACMEWRCQPSPLWFCLVWFWFYDNWESDSHFLELEDDDLIESLRAEVENEMQVLPTLSQKFTQLVSLKQWRRVGWDCCLFVWWVKGV